MRVALLNFRMVVGSLWLVSGCVEPVDVDARPSFWRVYETAVATTRPVDPFSLSSEKTLSVSVASVPLGVFVRNLVRDTNISVVVESSLDSKLISADMRDRPVSEILQLVARRFGAQLVKQGGTYYLGTLRAEDKGVLVRRVARLSSDDLAASTAVLLSENGRSKAFADGLIVVGDTVAVLQRVSDLLDRVEAVGSDTWVLQSMFIARKKSSGYDLGIDATVAGNFNRSYSGSASNQKANVTSTYQASSPAVPLTAVLSAVTTADSSFLQSQGISASGVLAASLVANGGALVASPLLLLADGEHGSVNVGQRVPIARSAVSNEGTVTTTGFDFIQTGTVFDARVREVDSHTARVEFDVSVTSFDGYSPQGGPIVSPSEVKSVVSVASGGVYLVGSLSNDSTRKGRPGPVSLGFRNDSENDVIDVWLRVYRVAGPVRSQSLAEISAGYPSSQSGVDSVGGAK